jgi:hypothetical protein
MLAVLCAASNVCDASDAIVVCTGTVCDDYPDNEHAATLDQAISAVRASADLTTIWLPPGTYTYNVNLTANDRGISIMGLGQGLTDAAPLEVTIQAQVTGAPVFSLTGVSGAVLVEGVTITGGRYGVEVNGGGGNVVFNRCYITNNIKTTPDTGHGVWCHGRTQARPKFINCSISHNGGDGVRVDQPTVSATSADAGVDLLNCTVLGNGGNGVYVADGAAARVRNSLVYGNNAGWTGTTMHETLFNGGAGDNGGLLADSGSEWAFGQPAGLGGTENGHADPTAGHTGSYVWGVNLSGDYTTNVDGDAQYASGDPVDDPNDVEQSGGGVPLTIPNGPTTPPTSATLTFPVTLVAPTNHPMVIGDVNVLVDIAHPCLRELTVSLEHGGTKVTLFPGASVAPTGCSAHLNQTLFDDEAGAALTSSDAPYHGAFKPYAALSAFDGLPAQGEWNLILEDANAGDIVLQEEGFELLDESLDNPPPQPAPDWSSSDSSNWLVHRIPNTKLDEYRNTVGGATISVYDQPGSEAWRNYSVSSGFRIADPSTATTGDKEFGIVFRYAGPQDYYLFRVRLGTDCASSSTPDADCLTVGVYQVTTEGISVLGTEQVVDPSEFVTLGQGEHATIDWNRDNFFMPGHVSINVRGDKIEQVLADLTVPITVLNANNVPVRSITRLVDVKIPPRDNDPRPSAAAHPMGTVGCYAEGIQAGFDYVHVEGETVGILNSWSIQVEPMHYVTTPPLNFSAVASRETVGMVFWRWLNTGPDSIAVVEYSKDGANWERLWWNRDLSAPEITDNAWTEQTFDVTGLAAKEPAFRVRWGYHAGRTPYSGWNIDDLSFKTQAGGGLVAAAKAFKYGAYNCAYNNTPFNRFNFYDAAGALDVNPLLDAAATWGKLLVSSPLLDKGNSGFTVDPYTKTDFEGEVRDAPPDIGADEVSGVSGGVLDWYYCEVTPAPIGRLAAGGLSVHIRAGAALAPYDVFIVPQGELRADFLTVPDRFIHLVRTAHTAGNWWGTNAAATDTVVFDDDGNGVPSEGDAIADGHGVVAMYSRAISNFVDPYPTSQAVTGREVLIDTMSPALALAFALPGSSFSASAFITSPPGIMDEGVITPVPGGPGACWFSNAATNLNVLVRATFLDPSVRDAAGNVLPSAPDELTGATLRPVSGFLGGSAVTVTGTADQILGGRTTPAPPAQWLWPMAPGADSLSGVVVELTYTSSGDTLLADWRFYEVYYDGIGPDPGDVPGIPWAFAANSGFQYHLMVQFAARDLAGNRTVQDPGLILDPVHIWWLLNTDVELRPRLSKGAELGVADAGIFHWRLVRKENPVTTGQPKPIFQYRLWRSVYEGKLPEDYGPYEGPYEPVPGTDWEPWSEVASMREYFLADVEGEISGGYVLLVVRGQDEAGNVSPWPPAGLAPDPDPDNSDGLLIDPTLVPSLNWTRFFVGTVPGGYTGQVDTNLVPAFWHERRDQNAPVPYNRDHDPDPNDPNQDGKYFGGAATVPLPALNSGQLLLARMRLGYTLPPALAGANKEILWEFDAPGLAGLLWFDPSDGQWKPVEPPFEGRVVLNEQEPVVYLAFPEDFRLKAPLYCVFRAWVDLPPPISVSDPTPATFSFTVTGSTTALLEPKDVKDHQPIVIRSHEEE